MIRKTKADLIRFPQSRRPFSIVFIAFALCLAAKKPEQPQDVMVTTKHGTVIGLSDQNIVSFLGIPFADPFSESLRWLPPVPIKSLGQPFPAKKFGSPCPHTDKFNAKQWFTKGFDGDTDCLNLNIWIPRKYFDLRENKKIPVMVFFPGGGFQVGSSSWTPFGLPIYHGAKLAQLGQVIVVTINYRTGTSGFFYEPSLIARAPQVGNLGLLDQIEALKWVKTSIGLFAGDNKNVTAFGSSSGAMSICNLLATTEAKGLFEKAIIESGSCWLSSIAYTSNISAEIVRKVGCDQPTSSDDRAKCLVNTPIEQLTGAEPEMDYQAPTLDNFNFSPVLDGTFFKKLPDDVIKSRQHNPVPILIGSNEHEIPIFMMKDAKVAWEKLFDHWLVEPKEKATVKLHYEQQLGKSYETMLSKLKTDFFYTCRARYFAGLLADNQEPAVYLYHFDKNILPAITPWMSGSFHGMELVYVFQNIPPYQWLPGVAQHLEFQERLGRLWTHFASFGNVQSDPAWQDWHPYSSSNRIAGLLGDKNGTLTDPHGSSCDLLEKIMKKLNGGISLVE